MAWILVIVIVAWFVLGDPSKNVANWFWPNNPAPWEDVDAFFYPNRHNLRISKANYNVGTVENCRDWAYAEAAIRRDPDMKRSDYECGIGRLEKIGSVTVYRITTD
ncbi:MAG: hypothetical protein O7D31_11925 [Alphaproteobacteria bacterium]|nr:hypothetical protein [Alphaproteobacteria bacterium]